MIFLQSPFFYYFTFCRLCHVLWHVARLDLRRPPTQASMRMPRMQIKRSFIHARHSIVLFASEASGVDAEHMLIAEDKCTAVFENVTTTHTHTQEEEEEESRKKFEPNVHRLGTE